MTEDDDYESVQRPITTMRLADRNTVIEQCARVVDIAVCAKHVDLDAIAAAIRSLKDK